MAETRPAAKTANPAALPGLSPEVAQPEILTANPSAPEREASPQTVAAPSSALAMDSTNLADSVAWKGTFPPPSSLPVVSTMSEERELPEIVRTPWMQGPDREGVRPGSGSIPHRPPVYMTFETFCRDHWLDGAGELVDAPWNKPDFASAVGEGALAALHATQFWKSRLFASAAAKLGILRPDCLRKEDVAAAAALWMTPGASLGLEGDRLLEEIRTATKLRSLSSSFIWRLRVVLVVLANPAGLLLRDLEEATQLAEIPYSLSTLLRGILLLSLQGFSPVAVLRDHASHGPEAVRAAEANLKKTRVELHATRTRLWNAAGGGARFTHCREAWAEFINEIEPLLTQLGPIEVGGLTQWDPAEIASEIRALPERHESIADHGGARYGDRAAMDNAALALFNAATNVNDAHSHLLRLRSGPRGPSMSQELATGARRLADLTPQDPGERFLVNLVSRTLQNQQAPEAERARLTHVPLDEVLDRPELLTSLAPISRDQAVDLESLGWPASLVRDPVLASAVLLARDPGRSAPSGATLEELADELGRSGRRHLLPFLAAVSDARTEENTRRAINDAFEAAYRSATELDRLAMDLTSLGRPRAPELQERAREGMALANFSDFSKADPWLLCAWLDALGTEARAHRDQVTASIRSRLGTLPLETAGLIESDLSAGRFGSAVRLLNGDPVEPVEPGIDRTLSWRSEAALRYPDPASRVKVELETMLAAGTVSGQDRLKKALLELWDQGLQGAPQQGDRKLRTAFAEYVFAARHRDRTLYEGGNEPDRYEIEAEKLWQWIADLGLNPSFIPQLRRALHSVVVLTPPTKLFVHGVVEQTGQRVAGLGMNRLAIVLCPYVTAQVRTELIRTFHRRGTPGVVLDSLDLCRLMNLGGPTPNLVVGLLELALEQQIWNRFNPFEIADGGKTLPEVFVGRKAEALRLFEAPDYTRLFSGRKLGKSALLRYVENNYDGQSLPSGNTLRVLYVSAAGFDSERAIVDQILSGLEQQLAFTTPPAALALNDPGDRLVRAMAAFMGGRKTESLLVFLDEADSFVEAQIHEYDRNRRREKCLSFRMRSHIEELKDRAGLPRVRFVCAGYRVTHTEKGTWASWGDVLRLDPLDPSEASRLIGGPLARLGIDASAEARTIAFKCGYQPAVLIRFGHELVTHLEKRIPLVPRDELPVVMHQDVSTVFSSSRVQGEIRTLTWNNFQGNRRGRMVFSALLLLMADLGPGAALEDAPPRVLERLRSICPDAHWLFAADALDSVSANLRDLVDRMLVVQESAGKYPAYRMRFPHHLPILLVEDQEAAISQEARADDISPAEDLGVFSILGKTHLEELRAWMAERQEAGWTSPIAAGHWSESLLHPGMGLADRLGIARDQVFMPEDLSSPPACGRGPIILAKASPDDAERWFSAATAPPAVLIGGVDLLRWAIGSRREVYVTGRLPQDRIGWWFNIVRGYEFDEPSAYARIAALTHGIPILVEAVDFALETVLGGEKGVSVSASHLDQALAQAEREVPACAAKLRDGDARARLTPREIEILRVVGHASVRVGGEPSEPLTEWVTECWTDVCGELDKFGIRPLVPADSQAIGLLFGSGLLPCATTAFMRNPIEHLVTVGKNDAMIRVLTHIS